MKRRRFIKTAAGTAFAVSAGARTLFAEKSVKPLRILILGGTGFTGPYQVRYALSRGHKVTTFNRGKSHPGELPSEVEQSASRVPVAVVGCQERPKSEIVK